MQSRHAPTHTRTYRRLVEGSTINGTTLLSTDYLNHFNEFVMMLELAADMPDMAEELEAWQPKSYQRHFEDSGFTHKALAIAAYDQSPIEYREPFDDTVADIDSLIGDASERVHRLIAEHDTEIAKHCTLEMAGELRSKIERAGAIINGARREDLDAAEADAEAVMGQDDIDALFA